MYALYLGIPVTADLKILSSPISNISLSTYRNQALSQAGRADATQLQMDPINGPQQFSRKRTFMRPFISDGAILDRSDLSDDEQLVQALGDRYSCLFALMILEILVPSERQIAISWASTRHHQWYFHHKYMLPFPRDRHTEEMGKQAIQILRRPFESQPSVL